MVEITDSSPNNMNALQIQAKISSLEKELGHYRAELEAARERETRINFGLAHTNERIGFFNITRLRVLLKLIFDGKTIETCDEISGHVYTVRVGVGVLIEQNGFADSTAQIYGLMMNENLEWRIKNNVQ